MRARRHVETKRESGSKPWRRLLRDLGVIAGVSLIGYVIVAIWISPAPLFGSRPHSTPRVLGLTEAKAREELAKVGFKVRVSGSRAHPSAPAGTVIWQDPPPAVVLQPNETVTLALSAGAAPVPMPDVIGLDTASARHILTAAGVKVGEISVINGRQEAGIVVATRPAVGVARPRGARVGLVVSRGPEEYP